MGRRAANVTQADIKRVICAVQDAGLPVVRVIIRPNGEVIVETAEKASPGAEMDEPQDTKRIIFL